MRGESNQGDSEPLGDSALIDRRHERARAEQVANF